jgi:hypothetical protein
LWRLLLILIMKGLEFVALGKFGHAERTSRLRPE